jgi:hypothetical protein
MQRSKPSAANGYSLKVETQIAGIALGARGIT